MSESVFNTKVYASVARKAQAEGIVMLENRDNALPLKKAQPVPLLQERHRVRRYGEHDICDRYQGSHS